LGNGVDNGSDEQLNKAPAINGNESTGKRMDSPFFGLLYLTITTTSNFIAVGTLKT
jgi:hypothetical protein